jgi:hypothetical protein
MTDNELPRRTARSDVGQPRSVVDAASPDLATVRRVLTLLAPAAEGDPAAQDEA